MNESIITGVKETLDFQYISDVSEFQSMTRDQQHEVIISHINDRIVNIVHSLHESTRHESAASWIRQAKAVTVADLVFKQKGDYVGYRDLYMQRYHPKFSETKPESDVPPESVKDLVGMGLMSQERRWVLEALRLNDEHGFYTEQEIDDILKMYWDWDMVKNSTRDRWEEFCKGFGEKSCSGPTVDEWQPSQVSDEFYCLDGYITIPRHVLDDGSRDRPMSEWVERLSKWVKTLEADIRRWCEDQPDIVSIEDPFVWGECFIVTNTCNPVQIQISVCPKISLAKLIQLEKEE